jgi:hypothetical protein
MTRREGRKLPDENRRNSQRSAYFTASETKALEKLASGPYESDSDVLRKAFALLVSVKHPELLQMLREDIQPSP